nr:transposase [Microbacterium sp. CIAB417]
MGGEVGDGVVEVDETFVGGVSIGRFGASTTKATVMVAVEKPGPGRKLGRIRLGLADRPNTLGLVAFATKSVVPGSTIHTDGARMMRWLSELGYTHEYATGCTAADRAAVLPGVHLTASLLKRWLTGTLHSGVAEYQRPYYLASSRSASTGATRPAAACCSTDSSNRPCTPTRTRSRTCSIPTPTGGLDC